MPFMGGVGVFSGKTHFSPLTFSLRMFIRCSVIYNVKTAARYESRLVFEALPLVATVADPSGLVEESHWDELTDESHST